jgi:hypothetical protein
MQHPLKKTILIVAFLCSISIAHTSCQNSTAASKPKSFTYDNVTINVNDQSLTFKNLRIYPVYAKDNLHENEKDYGHFISLDSALKTEKLVVSEKSITGNTNSNEQIVQRHFE